MLPRWKSAVKGFLNAVKEIFQVFLSQRFILACTEEFKEPLIIKQFIYFFCPKSTTWMFFFFCINCSLFGPLNLYFILPTDTPKCFFSR